MAEHWKTWGYAFSCALTLPEIRQRLNELGPWQWRERDSDEWGSYLWAGTSRIPGHPEWGSLRLLEDPSNAGFGISAKLQSSAPDWKERFERVRTRLFDELLPALGAVIRRESDDYYR